MVHLRDYPAGDKDVGGGEGNLMENDDASAEQSLINPLRVLFIALTHTHRRAEEDGPALRSTTLRGTACHLAAWQAARRYL